MLGTVERFKDVDERAGVHSDAALDRLSRQELAVLQEMALGASNAEIARCLYLPERTVNRSLAHIAQKLNLPDRHAAIRLACEQGLRARVGSR